MVDSSMQRSVLRCMAGESKRGNILNDQVLFCINPVCQRFTFQLTFYAVSIYYTVPVDMCFTTRGNCSSTNYYPELALSTWSVICMSI
ncbi:hypothetical protein GDO78_006413 [Eleutherodactylus coqui]|uniref:Uncharacterized protein n=1 Tax=Eleutherodactylus coqui TaxID=57060 RepID=A0A8J6KEK7_ELECQ|nr:hypothetical protein GDO78_006413 [Eleutherodactylus coqui]